MSKIMYGENDNYHYRSSSEMSLTEQLNSAKEALDAAIRLSQTNKSDFLDNKIIEIKERILQLEQEQSATINSYKETGLPIDEWIIIDKGLLFMIPERKEENNDIIRIIT